MPLSLPETLRRRPGREAYRLGAPVGGISSLVRERRLQRAHESLGSGEAPRSIQEVAFACGFRSEAQFSRAFRRRFGLTPSDARSQARIARAEALER